MPMDSKLIIFIVSICCDEKFHIGNFIMTDVNYEYIPRGYNIAKF